MNTDFKLTGQLDVLAEVETMLAAIPDAQLVRCGSKLEPQSKGERALGTVHNDAAKRAFFAHTNLQAVSRLHAAEAQAAADDAAEETAHIEHHKAAVLSDLLYEIAWSQIRSDMHHWCGSIGLRRDWLAVAIEAPEQQMPEMVKRMFGIE